MIISPLRIDHRPSLQFYTSHKGRVRWSDYGTGEWGDIWDLLSKYWGISIPEVQKRVMTDAPRIQAQEQSLDILFTKSAKSTSTHGTDTELQVKTRDWRDYDLSYWESYGISRPWLTFGDIYPISHIIFIKKGGKLLYPQTNTPMLLLSSRRGNLLSRYISLIARSSNGSTNMT